MRIWVHTHILICSLVCEYKVFACRVVFIIFFQLDTNLCLKAEIWYIKVNLEWNSIKCVYCSVGSYSRVSRTDQLWIYLIADWHKKLSCAWIHPAPWDSLLILRMVTLWELSKEAPSKSHHGSSFLHSSSLFSSSVILSLNSETMHSHSCWMGECCHNLHSPLSSLMHASWSISLGFRLFYFRELRTFHSEFYLFFPGCIFSPYKVIYNNTPVHGSHRVGGRTRKLGVPWWLGG